MANIPPLLKVELKSAEKDLNEATTQLAIAKDRFETLQVACKIVADHNAGIEQEKTAS